MNALDAAEKAYNLVGDVFYGDQIQFYARTFHDQENARADTFLRKLRTLRQKGLINFRPIDSRKLSKYKKIKDDIETNINR